MAKKKKNTWVKFRHKIVTAFFYPWFWLVAKIKYRIKFIGCKLKKRPYFIVCNHQTVSDQFFVSLLLKRTIYYVASEDLYDKGFLSKALKYLVAPIPIKKNATDVKTIMTMLKVAKEGGSIGIFPEGNRTYSGKTGYIKPAIGRLIKVLKLPVVVVNFNGGFGVSPRFSDKTRPGGMTIFVKKVIEYEEYCNLTDEECYNLIKDGITVNDYDYILDRSYKCGYGAEYMERAMYVCPHCGITKFYSEGNTVKCTKCNLTLNYDEHLKLTPTNGEFPFTRVCDWYDYQEEYISNLDLTKYFDTPAYVEEGDLYLCEMYKKPAKIIENAKIYLYADRYEFVTATDRKVFYFNDISGATAQGRILLTFYLGGKSYQIRSHKRFTVVAYLNIYYHYKNNLKGEHYVQPIIGTSAGREFLGL